MKSKWLIVGLMAGLGATPAAFADVADYMLNVEGTTYCPSNTQTVDSAGLCTNGNGLAAAGLTVNTLDTAFPGGTGLGTVQLTINGAGNHFVDFWLFEELNPVVAQDEYGIVGGSAGAGQSYQIDVPDHTYVGELGTPGAGSIVANTAANTLANTNYVPGTTPDDMFQCFGLATCNDYTSMAIGSQFSLGSNEEGVVNFTVSTTKPLSGFYLEQVAPVDSNNASEIDYFFTENTSIVPLSGVPEPGFLAPLAGLGIVLGLVIRRRSSAVQN